MLIAVVLVPRLALRPLVVGAVLVGHLGLALPVVLALVVGQPLAAAVAVVTVVAWPVALPLLRRLTKAAPGEITFQQPGVARAAQQVALALLAR